jgi:hypothetical protein
MRCGWPRASTPAARPMPELAAGSARGATARRHAPESTRRRPVASERPERTSARPVYCPGLSRGCQRGRSTPRSRCPSPRVRCRRGRRWACTCPAPRRGATGFESRSLGREVRSAGESNVARLTRAESPRRTLAATRAVESAACCAVLELRDGDRRIVMQLGRVDSPGVEREGSTDDRSGAAEGEGQTRALSVVPVGRKGKAPGLLNIAVGGPLL